MSENWGKGVSNNDIGWGQGSDNNSIGWGSAYSNSWSGDTELKRVVNPSVFGELLFWLNGEIVGDEFVDQTENGRNFAISNNDITIDGFPYKSIATISAPAADATLIAADIDNFLYDSGGTPNEIPVTAFFQNIGYENVIFSRHIAQVTDGVTGVETTEPHVLDMSMYDGAVEGDSLTAADEYFGTPTRVGGAIWVSKDGDDSTGDGSESLPYLTASKAYTEASDSDTIYLKTGTYAETFWNAITKEVDFVGIGDVLIKNTSGAEAVKITAAKTVGFYNLTMSGADVTGSTLRSSLNGVIINVNRCRFIDTSEGSSSYNSILTTSGAYLNEIKDSIFIMYSNGWGAIYNTSATKYTAVGCIFSGSTKAGVTGYSSGDNFNYCRVDLSNGYLIRGRVGASYSYKWNTFNLTSTARLAFDSFASGTGVFIFSYNTVTSSSTGDGILISEPMYSEVNITNNTFNYTSTTYTGRIISIEDITGTTNIISNTIQLDSLEFTALGIAVTSGGQTVGLTKINYNTLISKQLGGSFVRVGSDNTTANDDLVNGGEIIGNKAYGARYYDDVNTSCHGLFVGYNINWTYKYNYINGFGINLLLKGSANTYTSGGMFYNVSINPVTEAIYIKGVRDVLLYNNTCYNDVNEGKMLVRFSNTDGGDGATGCTLINNIIADVSNTSTTTDGLISVDSDSTTGLSSDYNCLYRPNGGNYAHYNGVGYTSLATWQVVGFDANSIDSDPLLTNPSLEEFYPTSSSPVSGVADDLGSTYEDVLSINNVFGVDPAVTETQVSAAWDIGAYVV